MKKRPITKLNEKTLKRTHVPMMLRLQQRHTTPSMFTPRDVYSMIHAVENNRVVGLFDGRKLVAYSILDTDVPDEDRKLLYDHINVVYKFAGSVVHSKYRGRGIQKMLLTSHVEYAISKRADAIMAYVHPDNKPSIANIESAGLDQLAYLFIESKQDYRYLYLRELC